MQRSLLILIPAVWVVAIAFISVQNATPVSVVFLAARSVALPFGVILGFCVAGGMIVTALLLALFSRRQRVQR
jgi:uncharacterized integral membrane protein